MRKKSPFFAPAFPVSIRSASIRSASARPFPAAFLAVLLVGLLLLLSLSGCARNGLSSETVDKKTPQEDNLIVVGVSQVGSESVWRTANTASIQQTFSKEKGYFLIFDNARQKQENQIKAIRSFISQQVDYIVLSPITEEGWDTVLEEAKAAGIPVILMDRKVHVSDTSLYTSWVGSDFTEEGRQAGLWLEDYLKGQMMTGRTIHIVVLQGTKGSTAMIGRTKGFEEIAKKHENWEILEQVDADFTTAKGKEEMARMLKTWPQIDVLVSQNDDMTFGALAALQEAGKTTGTGGDTAVISFDATRTALERVKSGSINVDIECNPAQGPYVESIIRLLEEGQIPNKDYYVDEQVFTQENVLDVLDNRNY